MESVVLGELWSSDEECGQTLVHSGEEGREINNFTLYPSTNLLLSLTFGQILKEAGGPRSLLM